MPVMSIYSIYKATNKINGKCYIGFATNWPRRKNKHRIASKNNNNKFYRAIRKHDWDNFEWSVLYQSKDREHTLKIMEPYFINEYDSYHGGYNATMGGEGVFGYSFSEESKRKMSERRKGHKYNLGQICTEETKQKLSKAMTGMKRSEETKEKHRLVQMGKKYSEESKQKMRLSALERERKKREEKMANNQKVLAIEV